MVEPPHTPFLWNQLAELGIADFTLRRWLQDGRVRRVLTGVYVPAELPDTLETRARCVALVQPAGAVLCDRTAAWVWGVDAHDPDERFAVSDLEIAVAPGEVRVRRKGVRGIERDLAPSEVAERHGVRLTTPERTAIDLACRRGRRSALAVLDAFMRTCGVTHDELSRQLLRFNGRRGVTQARELALRATPYAESPGESWTRCAVVDDGFPEPQAQIEVTENGVVVARLDLGYRQWRIAIEFDGEEFHGEDRREHDEARREWLRERGWYVIVVRKEQLRGPALRAWLDELAEVIEARSARPKTRYARRAEPWQRG